MKTSEILRQLADIIDAKSSEDNKDLAQQPLQLKYE